MQNPVGDVIIIEQKPDYLKSTYHFAIIAIASLILGGITSWVTWLIVKRDKR
ncbi:MAG: hypothetical protein WA865_18570 [Spirulinaceae cyanobacterium]